MDRLGSGMTHRSQIQIHYLLHRHQRRLTMLQTNLLRLTWRPAQQITRTKRSRTSALGVFLISYGDMRVWFQNGVGATYVIFMAGTCLAQEFALDADSVHVGGILLASCVRAQLLKTGNTALCAAALHPEGKSWE